MARNHDGRFLGSRKHGMNEGPLLAYRQAVREQVARKAASDRARTLAASKRTPQEQVKRLDALLGLGQGAKRERARIARKLRAG